MQKHPHLVAAFAFGEPASIEPNKRLALFAKLCAGKYDHAPIVTQDDVAIDSAFDVTYVANKQHRPATTLMVAHGAVAQAIAMNVKTIWVIAGRPHVWRCKRDLVMVIAESGHSIEVKVYDLIATTSYASWYDANSVQKRTQSLLQGGWYEPLFRLIPFPLYKRIAG